MELEGKIKKAGDAIIEKMKGFSNFEVRETLEYVNRNIDLRLFVN